MGKGQKDSIKATRLMNFSNHLNVSIPINVDKRMSYLLNSLNYRTANSLLYEKEKDGFSTIAVENKNFKHLIVNKKNTSIWGRNRIESEILHIYSFSLRELVWVTCQHR